MESQLTTDSAVSDCTRLLSRMQAAGALTFDGHIPSGEERALANEVRSFLPEIERRLATGTSLDIVSLHEIYRLLSAAARQKVAFSTRYDMFRRAMTLRLKGDKSASDEQLVEMASQLIRENKHGVELKYHAWVSSLMSEWIDDLNSPLCHTGLTDEQNYNRLTILLKADLWAFLTDSETAIKQHWVDCNLTVDINSMTRPTLSAFHRFILAARANFIASKRFDELKRAIEKIANNEYRF